MAIWLYCDKNNIVIATHHDVQNVDKSAYAMVTVVYSSPTSALIGQKAPSGLPVVQGAREASSEEAQPISVEDTK